MSTEVAHNVGRSIENDYDDDQSEVTVEEDTCTETGDEDEENEDYDEQEEDEEEQEEDPNHVYLECVEGNSSKFYELILEGTTVTTSYGRIGATGTTATKDYKTEDAAQKFFDKTIAEKEKKGYEQVKKGKKSSDDDGENDEEEEVKPKRGTAKKKAAPKKKEKGSDEDDDDDDQMDVEEGGGVNYGSDPNNAYLECTEGTSSKFYELNRDGTKVSTTYGRIGTGGSTATKDYGSIAAANDFYTKTLNEKLRKGYHHATKKEIPSIRPPVPAPVRAIKVSTSPVKNLPNPATTSKNFAYLICQEGTSNKFYEIIFNEPTNSVYTRYGRIGTTGMESNKDFSSKEEAKKFFEKTLQEKLRKGYEHSKPDENFGQDSGLLETKDDEDDLLKPTAGKVTATAAKAPAAARGKKRGKAEVDEEDEEEGEEEEEKPAKKRATKAESVKPAAATTKAKAAPAAAASPAAAKNGGSGSANSAYLEFIEGNSSKFYEIVVEGKTVTSKYGKIGTNGQTTTKSFDTNDKAQLFYQKTLAEKLLKGYQRA